MVHRENAFESLHEDRVPANLQVKKDTKKHTHIWMAATTKHSTEWKVGDIAIEVSSRNPFANDVKASRSDKGIVDDEHRQL